MEEESCRLPVSDGASDNGCIMEEGEQRKRLNSQTCQGELSRFAISIFCVCEPEWL